MSLPQARIEGSLLGTMAGDSLGGQVEAQTLGQLRQRYADESAFLALQPGPYGAATEMTAAVAVSLARFPEFNPADLAAEIVRTATVRRRYGHGTMIAIERLRAGESWTNAGTAAGGRTSFGNGAAVRSGPVALVYAEDAETMRWVAEEAAAITHSHALAAEGAVLHAAAVGLAALGGRREVDPAQFLLTVGAEAGMREYRSRYESAARLVERDAKAQHVVEMLGNGRSALGSVVTAAYCFACHPDDFERAIAKALSLGGNASSIAAMTGAISGARVGVKGVPQRWVEKLERATLSPERLHTIAADLASAARRIEKS